MKTDCNSYLFDFEPLEKREVKASFDGGPITSDAGGLLLREVESRCGILRQFSECFTDHRDPDLIEHTVRELVGQRVYGIALGYEDLIDHDDLRVDSLLAVLVGKKDPTGESRQRKQDKGKPLAGKSTLNRLELTQPGEPDRYKKVEIDVEEVARIVEQIRRHWPAVEIVIRGDSGFCRDKIMHWCEENGVHYILGLAKNSRLLRKTERQRKKARKRYALTRKAARVYGDFYYRTRTSWSRKRRVIAKAEHLAKGENPRFVVTSYTREAYDAQTLYEQEYCARGEMENRIKEQQLYLFADRTSTHEMLANQLRLWFSSVAYLLVSAFRRWGLQGTEMATAQCHTIRQKLFKLGAQIRVSVRRILISMATGYPYKRIFAAAYANLVKIPLFSP